MGTILEALAVIKGKDATGGTFDGIAAKINRITRAANALNRDVQKQLNMASVAEKQVARLDRAHTAIGGGVRYAAGAAAAYGAGHAAASIIEHTAKAASDRAHEETRMRASGMTQDEIEDADKLASGLSQKYKAISQTEIMHTARNVRAVVGTFEEATKIIDPLMQLRTVAMGALYMEHDPKIAAKSVTAQAENLLGNLGKPMAPAATKGLNWLASVPKGV